jgi:hypothetical protein
MMSHEAGKGHVWRMRQSLPVSRKKPKCSASAEERQGAESEPSYTQILPKGLREGYDVKVEGRGGLEALVCNFWLDLPDEPGLDRGTWQVLKDSGCSLYGPYRDEAEILQGPASRPEHETNGFPTKRLSAKYTMCQLGALAFSNNSHSQ